MNFGGRPSHGALLDGLETSLHLCSLRKSSSAGAQQGCALVEFKCGAFTLICIVLEVTSLPNAETSLKQEVLRLRDELIGVQAEDAERRFRFFLLQHDYRDLGKKFEEQTSLLRENMTRAYEAERRVIQLQEQQMQLKLECEALEKALKSSRSWRVGRMMTFPLRFLRRLLRS
jgi:hypothetical protein